MLLGHVTATGQVSSERPRVYISLAEWKGKAKQKAISDVAPLSAEDYAKLVNREFSNARSPLAASCATRIGRRAFVFHNIDRDDADDVWASIKPCRGIQSACEFQ